jgi:hypothetical protein
MAGIEGETAIHRPVEETLDFLADERHSNPRPPMGRFHALDWLRVLALLDD